VDFLTMAAGRPGVFCGGWPDARGRFSLVAEAAEARRAAVSMDRCLAGVSVTASRDKAGSAASRLAPRLEGVDPIPRLEPRDAAAGYAPDEVRREAERCLQCQCLACLPSCAYLRHYQGYPKAYARQVYNNLSIVQGNRTANKLINSCMLCGLCTEICPEDFSMAQLCLRARRLMVDGGTMPLSTHEFALADMEGANGPDFALMRAEPGAHRCAQLFFPGCQLGGEPEGKIPEPYAFLREKLVGGVGLALGCCGVPALWSGREDLFRETMDRFRRAWEALGRPRLVAACASCLEAFARGAPEIPAISLWRVLAEETGFPDTFGPTPPGPLAVHDPCASRHDAASQAAVRHILHDLGLATEELSLSKRLTQCCGYGGLLGTVDAALAATVAAERAGQSRADFVATCAMCRDRLARAGKRTYHLLDLLFPGEDPDPAGRPDPGFSRRHEQRSRLRRRLLATVWHETPPGEAAHGPALALAPEVAERLEVRHILEADAALVVAEAEASGRRFLDRATGRFLACSRPRRVTYWAEYAPAAGGAATVHTAYAHRMEIAGVTGEASPANVSMVYLPESGNWDCGACGEPLEPASVRVSYLDGGFSITLLACRRCGLALVPEYLAVGKMHEVERLMEEK
jgi:Fe-S oxidoreductase